MKSSIIRLVITFICVLSMFANSTFAANDTKSNGYMDKNIIDSSILEIDKDIKEGNLKKTGEEIVCNTKGEKSYKVQKYEKTKVLSTEEINGSKVQKIQTDYISRYEVCNDESDLSKGQKKSDALRVASLNPLNRVAATGTKTIGEYEDNYLCYAQSTITYYKKLVGSNYSYKLVSSSGKWTVTDPKFFNISNRSVWAVNKDLFASPSDVKKSPTTNTYNYSYSFSNYVSSVPSALGVCGVNMSCKISNGTKNWYFNHGNEIVLNGNPPFPMSGR